MHRNFENSEKTFEFKTLKYSTKMNRNKDIYMPKGCLNMDVDEFVRFAQAQAQKDAKELATKNEEAYINKVLKQSKSKSLENIRESIEMSRKPKMRVAQQYLCDNCDKTIQNPNEGFIVQGNIYVADPSVRGGLIGNNFPPEESFNLGQVHENVYCKKCFCELLQIPFSETPIEKSKYLPSSKPRSR